MFKSNLPQGFDIAKQYSPIRTEAEKERQRELYNDPEFRKMWNIKNQEAIDLKVQDPVWYANLVARNQAMAKDEKRNNAIAKTVTAQVSQEHDSHRVEPMLDDRRKDWCEVGTATAVRLDVQIVMCFVAFHVAD